MTRQRVGIALALALGMLITYEVVTSPGPNGVTVMRRRGAGAVSYGADCVCQQVDPAVVVRGETDHANQDGNIGYCSKTGSFSALDAGDLVSCTANIPRIQNGAVLTEAMTTNWLYDGTDFTAWGKLNVNVAVPTVAANLAKGPDGQQTADFICFPATTGADLSSMHNGSPYGASLPICPNDGGQCLQSIYLQGALPDGGACGGSDPTCTDGGADGGLVSTDGGVCGVDPNCYDGGLDFCSYDGVAWHCNTAAFVGSTWLRSSRDGGVSDSNGYWIFGNESLVSGIARPAQCVFAWGAMAESNTATVSSPIASTGTLANGQLWTRMADQVENRLKVTRTAWLGDSLSANTVASTTSATVYPRAPERYATDTGRTVDNWAVNGATLQTDCEAQWTNWAARSNPQQIVEWCGTNDIIIGGATGDATWNALDAWLEGTLLPTGAHVVLVNLTPWKGYSGYSAGLNTQRLAFNADMATWCALADGGVRFGVTCIDMAAALWDPADHDSLLAANAAPDHLHLSQVGALLAGDTVAAGAP